MPAERVVRILCICDHCGKEAALDCYERDWMCCNFPHRFWVDGWNLKRLGEATLACCLECASARELRT